MGRRRATGQRQEMGPRQAICSATGRATSRSGRGRWRAARTRITPTFARRADRRQREFLTRSGGATTEELGPPLVLPEDATPENFQPEAEWPVSAEIDEALKNRFRLFSGAQLKSGLKTGKDKRYLIPGILAAGQPGGIYGGFKNAENVAGGRPVDLVGQWHAVPRAVSGREAGAGAVSVGRSGARGAQGDGRPHLSRARHVAGVARELSAFARSAAARSARRRDGSPRVDRGSAADLPGDRPDLAGDGRLEQPQSVRRRRTVAGVGRAVRHDGLRDSRRASRQAFAQSGHAAHARRHCLERLCRVLRPVALGLATAAVQPRHRPSRVVALRGRPRGACRLVGARRRRGCTTRLAGRGTDGVRGRRLPHLEGGPPLGRLGRGTSGRTIRRHP